MWTVIKLAGRAAVWRTTRELTLVGLPSLLGWTVLLAALRIGMEYADASSPANFSPYGLNAVAATLAIELAVAALFVRQAGRTTALAAMFALSVLAEIVMAGVRLAIPVLAATIGAKGFAILSSPAAANAAFAAEIIWWIGAMVCVVRSLERVPRLRLIGRIAALWAALFAANALVPHAPVFAGRDFDISKANWWEFLHARYVERGTSPSSDGQQARIERLQPALLQAQTTGLLPHHNGETDVYAIGVAGSAGLDVFAKEVDGGLTAIGRVLPIKDRTVRLFNNPETLENVPLATADNFAAAVHQVAAVMDRNDDVLVLLLTSHGDRNGFVLKMPHRAADELTPQQLAETLDREGIKNRVVIVSACFSGIFLPPLKNENTIVMTAADATHTSFGCAPERDWTYFGDALFRQSLQPGTDFQQAFERASVLIRGWELMDHVDPSNPQGFFGPALVAKLAPFLAAPASADR